MTFHNNPDCSFVNVTFMSPKFTSMSFINKSEITLKRNPKLTLTNKNFSTDSVKVKHLIKPRKTQLLRGSSIYRDPCISTTRYDNNNSLQSQLKELHSINKHLVSAIVQYKKKCEFEMSKMRNELKEHRAQSNIRGVVVQKRFVEQIEELKTQVNDQKSELERKERDCREEVKKISRALKNVQNKHIMLQIKHQAMARRAFQYQKSTKELEDVLTDDEELIQNLKQQNTLLKMQLVYIEEKFERQFRKLKTAIDKAADQDPNSLKRAHPLTDDIPVNAPRPKKIKIKKEDGKGDKNCSKETAKDIELKRKTYAKVLTELKEANQSLKDELFVRQEKRKKKFIQWGIREITFKDAENKVNEGWEPPAGSTPINWPPDDWPEEGDIEEENMIKNSNHKNGENKKNNQDLNITDLIKELKSELRGNFEDVIIALMMEPVEFQAKQLHKAISGLGTEESTIVEILGIHNNEDVVNISNAYEGLYQTSLESDIKGDTSGTLKRLLVSLSTGGRDESDMVNEDAAFKDAQDLLQAGELLFAGTEESVFNAVLCQRNLPQLRLVFQKYEEIVGHTIEKAIENEFSGTVKDAMLQLIDCIRDRTLYLVTRLHDSMAGIGTDDRTLIRIVVSRSEIDLQDIKEVYEATYGKSLAERIADEVSSDVKKTLLSLLG